MSTPSINTSTPALNVLDPGVVLGDLQTAKKEAVSILQQSFKILGTFTADGAQSASEGTGTPDLEKPNLSSKVNDLSLRIGLLQDALNQLLAQVSKLEIKQRLNDLEKENKKQLDKFNEQMEKASAAAEKNKEAEKKGNVFEAISNWIQAVVSVISAVVTLVSAVGQILTNPVGAAALIVAGVALLGAAAVQITLAIDATMVACGKEGFLSDTDKEKMAKAVEILGYIAIAGSMIGLVGGVVVALGQAGKAAATLTGKEVGKLAASKLVATGMKEAAKKSMDMSVARVANYAYKESMSELMKLGTRMAITQAVGNGAKQIVTGVGDMKVADLSQEASDLQAEADKAEAAAAAIAALVAKLQAMIEQLQQELEDLIDQGQQTMAVIFGTIDESSESMTRIQQTTSA